MTFRFSDLWRWDGTIDRGAYALIGLVGFALKYSLDWSVSQFLFHREWSVLNYWAPLQDKTRITEIAGRNREFTSVLVLLALPFIWIGVAQTLRRLRSAGLPGWLVILFFVPLLNVVFFGFLSVAPPRENEAPIRIAGRRTLLDSLIPDSALGSATIGVLIAVLLGALGTWIAVRLFDEYGWGLFVAMPFCLGLTTALLYGHHQARSFRSSLCVSGMAVLVLGVVLLAFAMEGVICLVMALPIALPLALLGGAIGCHLQHRHWNRLEAPAVLGMFLFLVPSMMGIEAAFPQAPPVYAVRTSLEINAPPERVWQEVVAFSEIKEPPEWIFRAGIAWPMRAELRGRGPGAVRLCIFSTGAFVEPIEVWDEPRLLKFSVASNPRPMQELSPYGGLNAPHLDGFLVSRAGQFQLEHLRNGRTRLEGTTWYRHGLWPASYWRLWSDFLIHRIHLRVLRHIQRQSEQGTEAFRARPENSRKSGFGSVF